VPDGLRRCIEGNVVQGTSRALVEGVAFDRARVTSTNWLSYPILDVTEAPEAVDILLLNCPELPPAGAGESSIRPVAAALANAVFDASGVRLRRATGSSRRWRDQGHPRYGLGSLNRSDCGLHLLSGTSPRLSPERTLITPRGRALVR
jgi:hypothetical protein